MGEKSIELKLEYHSGIYSNQKDIDRSILYRRDFDIDYVSMETRIFVTEFEFRTILHLGLFQLNDITYDIIHKKYVVESNVQYWNLVLKHANDFDSDYLPF